MSRVGEKPIPIPEGVEVELRRNSVKVKGPKGVLEREVHPAVKVNLEEAVVTVARRGDTKLHKSLHGLTRSLIHNMVVGVTEGYTKVLEVEGIGYRVKKTGEGLNLQLGFSHPISFENPKGVEFEVESVPRRTDRPNFQCRVIVKGVDKELVGETAAKLRSLRKPEPYKGAGIRYEGEYIRRKAGKRAV